MFWVGFGVLHRRAERWEKMQTEVWPEVKGGGCVDSVDTGLCARRQLLDPPQAGPPHSGPLMQAFRGM